MHKLTYTIPVTVTESDSTQTTEDTISIHLGPLIEYETDLELSVTVASPSTQQDFVIEGSLKEGVLKNIDVVRFSISCILKSWMIYNIHCRERDLEQCVGVNCMLTFNTACRPQ